MDSHFFEILRNLGIPSAQHEEIKAIYFSESQQRDINLYPGVMEYISTLTERGITLSILTSKPRVSATHLIARFFECSNLDLWCPEDISSGRGKPAPDRLLEIISKSGIDPHETVFVGDCRPTQIVLPRLEFNSFCRLGLWR